MRDIPELGFAEDEDEAGAAGVVVCCVVLVSFAASFSSPRIVSRRDSTPATAWERREPHRDLFPDAIAAWSRLGCLPGGVSGWPSNGESSGTIYRRVASWDPALYAGGIGRFLVTQVIKFSSSVGFVGFGLKGACVFRRLG
jgi:hypothetical protein